jgi:hypothetical protein
MHQHRPVAPNYHEDFFAWTRHQAARLRAFKETSRELPADLDLDHLAEEIEDLGKAELRGVTSLIRSIMIHLIKAASDPDAAAVRHWRSEVTAFHVELPDRYAASMRQHIDMQKLWDGAREIAEAQLEEHGKVLSRDVPAVCPFAISDLLGESFSFDHAMERLRSSPGQL